MHSITVENYAKHIFLIAQESEERVVPMGIVAEALKVVPGTATSMVKALSKSGLVNYEPRAGVKLTESGNKLALRVLRRHRLIEYFMVETLKMDWSEIHEEAETLEHAISDRFLDRLDKFLGEPRYDPHGDPIPTANGELIERDLINLSVCNAGDNAIVRRISDQDVSFLNFAQECGLVPGNTLSVIKRNDVANCIEINPQKQALMTLGIQAATKIWVELT